MPDRFEPKLSDYTRKLGTLYSNSDGTFSASAEHEIKGPPSLKEKALRLAIKAGNFIYGATPEEQATNQILGFGNPMAVGGLVMRGPNAIKNALKVQETAKKIKENILNNLEYYSSGGLKQALEINKKLPSRSLKSAVGSEGVKNINEFVDSLAYFKAKYPKLTDPESGIVNNYTLENPWNDKIDGQFNIMDKIANYSGIGDMINALGHETTHGIQQARGRYDFLAPNPIEPSKWGFGKMQKEPYTYAYEDFKKYFNQPVEVQAERGGSTAQKTAIHYEEALKEAEKAQELMNKARMLAEIKQIESRPGIYKQRKIDEIYKKYGFSPRGGTIAQRLAEFE